MILEESELHRLVRSSRPDRLDDRWLSKCRHLFMSTLRQSNAESIPHSRKLPVFSSVPSAIIKKFVLVLTDLLDAVVDIHDKLHIDVLFNPSRDSTSSSITVQSKSLYSLACDPCMPDQSFLFAPSLFSALIFLFFSDLRRHLGNSFLLLA